MPQVPMRQTGDSNSPVAQWCIRSYQAGDEEAWLGLIRSCWDCDHAVFNRPPSVDALRMILQHPSMDPLGNLWFADVRGALVGYAELWHDPGRTRKVFRGLVHPDWRRKGLGTELLRQVEQRARDLGGARIDAMVAERQVNGRAFLSSRGLREVHRCWEMVLPANLAVPVGEWPRGYTRRCFVVGQDEATSTEIENASFRDEWESAPVRVGEITGFVRSPSFRADGVIYAVSSGKVVGECWAWMEREVGAIGKDREGDIWCLCVHPFHRKRGLGRSLLLAGIEWLRQQGATTIKLGVDGANDRAKRLYESVGFRPNRTDLWYREEL